MGILEKYRQDRDDQIVKKLKAENKKLKAKVLLAMSQNYCKICGNILDSYVPPKEKNEH